MITNSTLEAQIKTEKPYPEDSLIKTIMDEMNKTFAILEQPSFFILEEDEIGSFSLDRKQSFKDRFFNKPIDLGGGKKKSKADIFLENPARRTFRKIVMNPKIIGHYEQSGVWFYNLWKGFSISPQQGCCEKIMHHIQEVICAGNIDHYNYLINLLANWVQKPEERTVAVLLRGPQGCGKNIFVDSIGTLFGKAYGVYDDVERLLGKFNSDLATKILVFCDEALWGGRKGDSGKLKAAITGDFLWLEQKGKDKIELPNFRKFIAASNERFALPLDADDRRWFVLECSGHRISNEKYFIDIKEELDKGGHSALLYTLLHRDISKFNPRKLPVNDNAFDLKLQCASSFIQFLHTALSDERIDLASSNGFPWGETGVIIRTDFLRDHYKDFCTKERLQIIGERECGWALKNLFKDTLFERKRKRFDRERHPVYILPALSISRKCLATYFHIFDMEIIFPKDEEEA